MSEICDHTIMRNAINGYGLPLGESEEGEISGRSKDTEHPAHNRVRIVLERRLGAEHSAGFTTC